MLPLAHVEWSDWTGTLINKEEGKTNIFGLVEFKLISLLIFHRFLHRWEIRKFFCFVFFFLLNFDTNRQMSAFLIHGIIFVINRQIVQGCFVGCLLWREKKAAGTDELMRQSCIGEKTFGCVLKQAWLGLAHKVFTVYPSASLTVLFKCFTVFDWNECDKRKRG